MAKLTLTDISTGYSSTSVINANNALIETALENTLSRDGTSPNQMNANLDMNSYRITNLVTAVSNDEPVTLGQANTLAGVTNPLTQDSVAAVLWPQTSAETTAGVTPTNYEYEPGDARRYGAVADGSTDDATAINNAATVAVAMGVPLILQENHSVDSTIVFDSDGLKILGPGFDKSTITHSTSTTPAVEFKAKHFHVQDCKFNETKINWTWRSLFQQCDFGVFEISEDALTNGTFWNTFQRCIFYDWKRVLGNYNANSHYGCEWRTNGTGPLIDIDGTVGTNGECHANVFNGDASFGNGTGIVDDIGQGNLYLNMYMEAVATPFTGFLGDWIGGTFNEDTDKVANRLMDHFDIFRPRLYTGSRKTGGFFRRHSPDNLVFNGTGEKGNHYNFTVSSNTTVSVIDSGDDANLPAVNGYRFQVTSQSFQVIDFSLTADQIRRAKELGGNVSLSFSAKYTSGNGLVYARRDGSDSVAGGLDATTWENYHFSDDMSSVATSFSFRIYLTTSSGNADVSITNIRLNYGTEAALYVDSGDQFGYIDALADDAATSFTPHLETGIVDVIVEGSTADSGVMLYDAASGGASSVSIGGGADFNVTTGALAGTTGTDVKLTASAHTDGKIYIENRTGAAANIRYRVR